MDKDRTPTTVNLNDGHRDRMDNRNLNRSDVVNEALDYYWESKGHVENALVEHRRDELEQKADALESRAEKKREQAKELQETDSPGCEDVGGVDNQRNETWRDAVTTIEPPETKLKSASDTNDDWAPSVDSNGVSFWADQLGVTPREFCDLYAEKRKELVE